MRHLIFFCCLSGCLTVCAQGLDLNVAAEISETGRDRNITTQLQRLIDRCSRAGGGTVHFPAGAYLTGSLVLKDNVYLDLGAGAIVYGSTDLNDYPEAAGKSLVYGNGITNAGISGSGTLNGQGDSFWRGKEHPYRRPERFILIENGTNIRFNDFTLLNTPNWNLEVRNCDGVWIDGLTMISDRKSPNSDGIDPVSSRNVFISNCYIDTGDDAICPKAQDGVATENLVVTNCVLISDDSAIKLGTRSEDPIRNCLFSNIIIRNSDYGIAFFAKDGGTFENIRFDNIHIETTADAAPDPTKPPGTYPIFLDLERRRPQDELGAIRDIYFSNITIDSPSGRCLFLGQPEGRLQNINLSNISFTLHERSDFTGSKKPRGVRSLVDRAANDYSDVPAFFAFAHVDGLHIDGLSIRDLSTDTLNERRLIWGLDVHNLTVDRLRDRLTVANRRLPLIDLTQARRVEIANSSPASTSVPFLQLTGANTSGVVLRGNDLSRVGKLRRAADVPKDAVRHAGNTPVE